MGSSGQVSVPDRPAEAETITGGFVDLIGLIEVMWDVHLLEATMKPGSAVGASSPPKRREHPRFSGWFRRTTLIDAFIKYVCLVGGEKCFHLANIACTTIRVGITILLSCYTLYGISVPHCEPQSHT